MLDRATIDRLSRAPEKNAPMLNVALAEEGTAAVLLSLARSPAARAGGARGRRRSRRARGRRRRARSRTRRPRITSPSRADLDRLLVAHPRSPDAVRDAVLARHAGDAFFVLAAAMPPARDARRRDPRRRLACRLARARPALARAVDAAAVPAAHAGRVVAGPERPPPRGRRPHRPRSRAARRARARSGPAGAPRGRLQPLRRRRARPPRRRGSRARRAPARRRPAHGTARRRRPRGRRGRLGVESARFAAALRAMAAGGVLAPDVLRALSGAAGDLDDEGALLAGQVLPRRELGALVDQIVDQRSRLAARPEPRGGHRLRPLLPWGDAAATAALRRRGGARGGRLRRGESAEPHHHRREPPHRQGPPRRLGRRGAGALRARRPRPRPRRSRAPPHRRRPHDPRPRRGAPPRDGGRALRAPPARRGTVPGALLELAWADPRVPDARLLRARRAPRQAQEARRGSARGRD